MQANENMDIGPVMVPSLSGIASRGTASVGRGGGSEHKPKSKESFHERFKGRMSHIDLNGHLGVVKKQASPILKQDETTFNSPGKLPQTTNPYSQVEALSESFANYHFFGSPPSRNHYQGVSDFSSALEPLGY